MYTEFWFCGILIGIALVLIFRECYLIIKMKLEVWNRHVLLRREMMLRRALEDRQNNIELGRQNNRYGDIFFIEPNSQEAARIREQLEKDEKDLPSYDEVMRMCNLTTPTAAAAASPSLPTSPVVETGPIGIVALPAPPYSETDPNPSSIVVSPSALESAPSTSRAAQIPA
ncbi:uncharacterized protein LOC133841443 isoform X8 [Drosophila sulfurigaster albostrigata]|uniref:uncharacterized protein LOC133841443 isoform X8 n=1 Tax=Drosophila sulfurigaster albostrigata TaxID=89887 RepID=UPI002D219BB1|nr:uncharacterized protein LOC133841443 isoform X8 [Drosophila sulfurigaster albostrigata]